ncbi:MULTISPECIES: trans-sulfuration enzyme family protein [Rhizobium]|uniref:Cystathionine gamma-synthase n=1 Tax=Rhizobium sophoriradicis TaxID=1535245 RepID=A0A2A5KMW8_9HYPH|nr:MULTISPECIES: aminotransferase class V-fold PLP-dependent enzyme [Rhizobium]ARQ59872.1 pyridoxal phosphate-dependent Cys/Met metabolism protein [Rhizobium sp. Kim5]PCK78352.1 cystathionine gamma-synthase [Rhizobium sophoriradicis]RSC05041.1 aminotransferase class V-fold PLP-dependent enzyme [Rhizobium sophoriradicis]UWU33834.1 aminotransferase class V-fold PLP-dependent enzyme [Rhizobium leguminosarum bv. phaseoli]
MTATRLSDLPARGIDQHKVVPAANAGQPSRETLALNGGLVIDPATKAIAPNISMSVNNVLTSGDGPFSADGVDDLTALPFLYARWTNPTVRQLEQRLAALEGADDAVATATGLAAIGATFFTFLKKGDHLILSDICYAGANELARRILPDYGIEVTPVNMSRPEDVAAAFRPNTRLVHCESPCNPILRLTDLAAIAELARKHGALMSVDSTLATPVATQPLLLGVDLVIHSLTKFINGHGDALGGVVCGRKELVEKIRSRAGVYLGAAMPAMNAWLIMRGIDTLFPRIRTISESAAKIAAFLQGHSAVEAVTYPGLASHPQHDLAKRQMGMFGGILTFQVRDPGQMAQQLAERLKVVHYAFSLGHQRSIVVLLDTQEIMKSTYQLTGEQLEDYRRFAGHGVFRLSVGLEATDDLIVDLDQAISV